MLYEGKISGIGNATTRQNEITADDLAILRNYIYGWDYGVINRQGYNFNATYDKNANIVTIEKGIMFAYGYFGILPESIIIPFIKPTATQYRIIYAEIDRSMIPNTFTVKIKNNQGSDRIKPTTFRQDYLTAVRTGVFQLPLWVVKLDISGIVEVVDIRELKDYIKQVKHSDNTTGLVTGSISSSATSETQPTTDKSGKLATTEFVHLATRNYIDNDGSTEGIYNVTITPIDIDETNKIRFAPSQLILNKTKTEGSFTVELESGWEVDDFSYVGNITVTSENNLYTVKLKSSPTEDDSIKINFYLYKS